MINLEIWKKNIFDALSALSNLDEQKKTWLDLSDNRISSPEEEYLRLTEDNLFNEFIQESLLHLNQTQIEDSKSFIIQLDNYFEAFSDFPDPKIVIDDPEWINICHKADMLIDTLDLRKYANK